MKIFKRFTTWFNIHPRAADIMVTLVFTVLALLNLYVNWGTDTPLPAGYAIVLTLLVVLPLMIRRHYPLGVLLFMTIAIIVLRSFSIPESSFTFYALLLGFFGAGAYGRQRYRTWARAISATAAISFLSYSIFFQQTGVNVPAQTILYQLTVILLNIFLFAAAWWIGEIFRTGQQRELDLRERTSQLEKERDENARRAVVEERVRIARELHDVVAHHVSVMGIQAGAARRILKQPPEKVNEVLSQIEASSRQALAEMQRLLGFLREQNQVDEIAPQPSLNQLDRLLEQMRSAGISTSVKIEGDEKLLPPGVDLSAYRIIQEALTNTLKHAGNAEVNIIMRYTSDNLDLEIRDNGKVASSGTSIDNKGRGLIGMRERVTLHGGEFHAGRLPEGGFLVKAKLPLTGWNR